ncbi:MAG: 5'-methylthioadenosine/adenosylhomocysteine nucleosidase [Clostridia bacterium]|nr:5'-methylthioadenosine/adenosylhomocysteine nucleosidase [Clostridia bacterium]
MISSDVTGVIGAMEVEIESLAAAMEDRREERVGDLLFYSGMLSGRRAVVVRSGIGKVNAARCTQALIDRYAPARIINTGIAGGLLPGLKVGDIVVAGGLVQHDFDVSAFGYAPGYMFSGDRDKPTVYPADEALSALLHDTAAELAGAERVRRGTIASGDQFIAGSEAKSRIYESFGAAAAEMEGAAIAQVAFLAGVPFTVIRAISDLADGSASESYDAFERETAMTSAAILKEALRRLP